MPRRALVLGASGLVGSHCVGLLAERSEYDEVTCLVRRQGVVPKHPKLRERVVDFDTLDALDAQDAAEDFYCAVGTTMKKAGSREAFRAVDYELPLRVAKLAVKSGTKRIALVSSVGASAAASNFYLATKGALEDALAAFDLEALHILRPSLLLGERNESRPGESLAITVGRWTGGLFVGPIQKYRPISADDVARAMVHAMLGDAPSPPRQVYEYAALEAWVAKAPGV